MTRKESKALRGVNHTQLLELMKVTQEKAQASRGKKISLLLGLTGDGKTTTLYRITGVDLVEEADEFGFGSCVRVADPAQEIHGKIGNTEESETLFPDIAEIQNLTLCDLPGYGDTRDGLNISKKLCSVAALPLIIKQADSISGLIICCNVRKVFGKTKGHQLRELSRAISDTIASREILSLDNIQFVLTHVPKTMDVAGFKKSVEQKINAKKELIQLKVDLCNQLVNEMPLKKGATPDEIKGLIEGMGNDGSDLGGNENVQRFLVCLEEITSLSMELFTLTLMKEKDCFVVRVKGSDDTVSLREKLTQLQSQDPIPKEYFSFTSLPNSELSLWRELIEQVVDRYSALLEKQEHLDQEKKLLATIRDLQDDWKKLYQTAQAHLNSKERLAICKQVLMGAQNEITKALEDSISHKEREIERLQRVLQHIDTDELTTYTPQSLGPKKFALCNPIRSNIMAAISASAHASVAGVLGTVACPFVFLYGVAKVCYKLGSSESISEMGQNVRKFSPLLALTWSTKVKRYRLENCFPWEARFSYSGVPFEDFKLTPPRREAHSSVSEFTDDKVYFWGNAMSNSAEGLLKATCYRYNGGVPPAVELEPSIVLFVKKRLHPDNQYTIISSKRRIHLLEIGLTKYCKDELARLKNRFDRDNSLLEEGGEDNLRIVTSRGLDAVNESIARLGLVEDKVEQAKGRVTSDIASMAARLGLMRFMLSVVPVSERIRSTLTEEEENVAKETRSRYGSGVQRLFESWNKTSCDGGSKAKIFEEPLVSNIE